MKLEEGCKIYKDKISAIKNCYLQNSINQFQTHIKNNEMNPAYFRQPRQTVLVSKGQNSISSDHPLFYVKQKNYFLQQLSNKVALQSKFNQIDLKRNVRVDHLILRHDNINKNIQKQQNRRKMFLSSNQFKPIVGMGQQQKSRLKQQKQAQNLRQQLYKNYVQQCVIYQAPSKDNDQSHNYEQFQLVRQKQQLKNFTVLSDYRSDPTRKKQLYLLDLEIAKLKEEQNLEKLVKKRSNECTNNHLLSKMSNTILSSYMVYFDQIFDAMMDEILQEEVVYFNSLEANYHLNAGQQQQQQKNKNKTTNHLNQNANAKFKFSSNNDANKLAGDVKAMKMMELVRQLDELAYD